MCALIVELFPCCCCINGVKCALLLLKGSCCGCINRGFGELCAVVVVA
jgi:hypothetical protein